MFRVVTLVTLVFLMLGALAAMETPDPKQPSEHQLLRIGTCDSLALAAGNVDEQAATDTLRSFIKDETGFNNEILKQDGWKDMVDKMRKGQLDLGVFQGYEFAWAKEKYPELNPLAIAMNVYRNRYAYVVARKDSSLSDFSSLKGQAMAIPQSVEGQLSLFVDHLAKQAGKSADAYFSRVTHPKSIEDTLDDVVDGVVQAAVVDRVGVEAYKRLKPGRFQQLKEVVHSGPFPSPVVACYDRKLDTRAVDKVVNGLLNSNQTDRGQRLLEMFKLTRFERPPAGFDQLLQATRREYPLSDQAAGSLVQPASRASNR